MVPTADVMQLLSGLSAALCIEGPAGIGKTHRWQAAVKTARAHGWRVLEARPVEAETRLGGCGLFDLLATVTDDELALLPEPQADALAVATLRRAGTAHPDGRAIGISLSGLVTALVTQAPVLLAVDDVQWLDPATADALRFVARRLPDRNAALLLAWRTDRPDTPRPQLLDELDAAGRLIRHLVDPMPAHELEALVADRANLTPATVARVVELSGGNPFFALELAAAAARARRPLVVPPSVAHVAGQRLAALPGAVKVTLAAAAALTRPTLRVLRELGWDDGIPGAERADVITVDGGRIRFTHPVLSEVAYGLLTPSERLAVHRLLATVVDDVEERARHLALGAEGPDADTAATIDVAVGHALARGDRPAARALVRHALAITPDRDALRPERELALGELLAWAGELDEARTLLRGVADGPYEPRLRAAAFALLAGEDLGATSNAADARAALVLAQRLGDTVLIARARVALAHASIAWADVESHARSAISALGDTAAPPRETLTAALVMAGEARFRQDGTVDHDLFARAMALDAAGIPPPLYLRSMSVYAAVLFCNDQPGEARRLLTDLLKIADAERDDVGVPEVLFSLVRLESFTGRLDVAEQLAERHERYARRIGGSAWVDSLVLRADLRYLRGDLAGARDLLAQSVRIGGVPRYADMLRQITLGRCLVVDDRPAEAAAEFAAAAEALRVSGTGEPSRWGFVGDWVEALLACGRRDEAEQVLTHYEALVRMSPGRVGLPIAQRARALIALADGDEAAALEFADAALAALEGTDRPLYIGLTLAVKGRALRRFRRKAAARDALQAALIVFESYGAALYVDRTRAELNRVGLRPPAGPDLTDTERRIAELVASGLSNGEVAAALFLSRKTVEATLGRVYRKLDIRSRAELGRRL